MAPKIMNEKTYYNILKLVELNGILKYIAHKKGSMHSFWDIVAENEMFINDYAKINILRSKEGKLKELIDYASKRIQDHNKKA